MLTQEKETEIPGIGMTTLVNHQPSTYLPSEAAAFMRSRDQHGVLSNMSFQGLVINACGLTFQCSEGIYQAMKFPDHPSFQQSIGQARTGMDAKKLAYSRPMDLGAEEWKTLKVDAMALALAVKLAQHPTTFGAGLCQGRRQNIPLWRRESVPPG